MTKTGSALRRQMILRVLARDVDAGADAAAVARAAVNAWEKLALQLVPLIGEGGVLALYSRSLHLARSARPWLGLAHEPERADAPFAALQATLERCEPAEAKEANCALLVAYTELLATFIGEQLTTRILGSAWSEAGPDETQENLE